MHRANIIEAGVLLALLAVLGAIGQLAIVFRGTGLGTAEQLTYVNSLLILTITLYLVIHRLFAYLEAEGHLDRDA